MVQKIVGRDDQMAGALNVGGQRSDQLLVEFVQMGVRGVQQLLMKPFDVVRAQPEFGELEAQQLEDPAQGRDGSGAARS